MGKTYFNLQNLQTEGEVTKRTSINRFKKHSDLHVLILFLLK